MMRTEMSDQIQKYKSQLIFSMVIGVLLSVGGIWGLFSFQHFSQRIEIGLSLLIVCFGMGSLVFGLKDWLIFSKGKTLSIIKHAIALRDGELTIDESANLYELWMFCDVPFFYLHGTIQFMGNSDRESQTIELPHHSPWMMWWWRSRLYGPPIVWRPSEKESCVSGNYRIKFNLKPSFTDTIYRDLVPIHDVELITVLLKSTSTK